MFRKCYQQGDRLLVQYCYVPTRMQYKQDKEETAAETTVLTVESIEQITKQMMMM